MPSQSDDPADIPGDFTRSKSSRLRLMRSNSAQTSGIPCYPMYNNPRGLALIIDIEQYENDVQERRIGSHVSKAQNDLYYRMIEIRMMELVNYNLFSAKLI